MLQKKKNNIIFKLLMDLKKYKYDFFFKNKNIYLKNLYLYFNLNKHISLSLQKNNYFYYFNGVVTTSLFFWNFGLQKYISTFKFLVNLNRKKKKKIFQKSFSLLQFKTLYTKKIKYFGKYYKKKNKLHNSLFHFYVKNTANNINFLNKNKSILSFFIFSYNKLYTDLFLFNNSYNNLLFFDYSINLFQHVNIDIVFYLEKILNLFFVLRVLFSKKLFKGNQVIFKKNNNINFFFIRIKALPLLSLYSYNKIFFKFKNFLLFNFYNINNCKFIDKSRNTTKFLNLYFFNNYKYNSILNIFNNFNNFFSSSNKNIIMFSSRKINILNYNYDNFKFLFFKSWLKKINLEKKKKKNKKKKFIKFKFLKNIYYKNNNLKKTWFYYLKYYKRVTFVRKFKRLKFIYFKKINKDKKNIISIFKLYSFKNFSFNDINKSSLSFLYANSFSFYKYISVYQLLINFFNYKKLLKNLNFNKIWSFFKLCKLNNNLNNSNISNIKFIINKLIKQYSFLRYYKKENKKKKKEFFTTFKLLQILRLYKQDLTSYHGYKGIYFFKNIFSLFDKYKYTFWNKYKLFLKPKALLLLLNKLQFNQLSNIFFDLNSDLVVSSNNLNHIFKYKYFWLYLLQISTIDKNYFYNYSLFLYNKNYIISNFYYLWKWLSLFNMYFSGELSTIDDKNLKNTDSFLFNLNKNISFNNFSYLFNVKNLSFNLFFIKRLRLFLKFFLKKNIIFYKKLYWLNLYYCKYSNYLNWRVKKKKVKKKNKKRRYTFIKLRNIFLNCKHFNYYFRRTYKYNKNYNKFNKFKIFNILKKKENYLLNKLVVIVVNIQLNNTYVTATDLFGNVLVKACAGVLGIKGPKRSTPVATEEVTSFICQHLKKNNYKFIILRLSGILYTRKMKAAIKALSPHKFVVMRALNITPKGHNGIRLKKRKRL